MMTLVLATLLMAQTPGRGELAPAKPAAKAEAKPKAKKKAMVPSPDKQAEYRRLLAKKKLKRDMQDAARARNRAAYEKQMAAMTKEQQKQFKEMLPFMLEAQRNNIAAADAQARYFQMNRIAGAQERQAAAQQWNAWNNMVRNGLIAQEMRRESR